MDAMDKQIREAEREVARYEAALQGSSRILEKLIAKKQAEARKTVGERMAEEMVVLDVSDDLGEVIFAPSAHEQRIIQGRFTKGAALVSELRRHIAAAIDKARADEREACAAIAEGRGEQVPGTRCESCCDQLATAIRSRL